MTAANIAIAQATRRIHMGMIVIVTSSDSGVKMALESLEKCIDLHVNIDQFSVFNNSYFVVFSLPARKG